MVRKYRGLCNHFDIPVPTHLFCPENRKKLKGICRSQSMFFSGNKRSFWDTFWTLAQNSEVGISSRKINFYELNYSIASNWILVWGKNEEGWPSKKGCFLINLPPCSTDDLAGFFHGASSPNEHPTNFDVPNKRCFFPRLIGGASNSFFFAATFDRVYPQFS